jgi:hypothetical protein
LASGGEVFEGGGFYWSLLLAVGEVEPLGHKKVSGVGFQDEQGAGSMERGV